MPIPGGGHEHVGTDQQDDRADVRRQGEHGTPSGEQESISARGAGFTSRCCRSQSAVVRRSHFFAAIPFVLAFAHGLRPRLARGLALAGEFTMRNIGFLTALVFFLLVGETSAISQTQPRNQPPPAKPAPYKIVAVKPPQPMNDAAREGIRKQIGEAAQKKDRAALAKLVVAEGFFWERENGDRADKRKPGADNFGAALGLNNKDGAGWDMLASIADDPTGSPSTEHKGAVCAPADPTFDVKAFNDLMQATKTDPDEWAYPVSANVEVRATPQPGG